MAKRLTVRSRAPGWSELIPGKHCAIHSHPLRSVDACQFLRTGEYLNNSGAQQHYIYSNYTHVARDMLLNGINVLAQAVACEGSGDSMRLSLSNNPDVMLDLIDLANAQPERAHHGDRRDQPQDAVHAQRRRGGPVGIRLHCR
jgi:hypothetical protein